MRSNRVRLRVDGLEDRWTPATAADVLSASTQVTAAAAFFRSVSSDPGWMFTPQLQSFVRAKLQSIVNQSAAAITLAHHPVSGVPAPVLSALAARAQANEALAIRISHFVGVSVGLPTAGTPATPKPPANDAGMTNTMPDPNATNWVAQGTQGLKVWDVVTGTGTPVPASGSVSISVFYTGWLASNGTKFDSRRSPAAPATFSLTGLIQGWQQGIPGMKPGGIRRLYVPAALGYGAAGSPPNIPANADLIFEIKLISHTP